MHSSELRVFEAVARLGGMGKAAEELNTVQSNVTARIRQLEEQLGIVLFERHSRGVSLTEAGERLMPYAVKVARLLEEAAQAAVDDGSPRGKLTIGTLETTAAMRLSPILGEFVTAHPDVDLNVRTGTTEELVRAVVQRDVEGAFVCGPVDHEALIHETIFHEELVVATGPEIRSLDALLGRGELKIVMLRLGCSYRQRLEEILARRGIVGLRRMEFGTIESIIGCVAGGIGVTLMPLHLLKAKADSGVINLHRLPPPEAQVDTVFVRRCDALASSAMRAFIEAARARFSQNRAAE